MCSTASSPKTIIALGRFERSPIPNRKPRTQCPCLWSLRSAWNVSTTMSATTLCATSWCAKNDIEFLSCCWSFPAPFRLINHQKLQSCLVSSLNSIETNQIQFSKVHMSTSDVLPPYSLRTVLRGNVSQSAQGPIQEVSEVVHINTSSCRILSLLTQPRVPITSIMRVFFFFSKHTRTQPMIWQHLPVAFEDLFPRSDINSATCSTLPSGKRKVATFHVRILRLLTMY